ncbi:MAG: PIG-L family deacetylase [Acidimicrobiia bacterium]|nr:PIG-L family deacetylase [Acidimicrobiia bacterium]MDH5518971.1 PIG-L family deacetylase [Acidimicrobiia bacterium]
MATLVCFHAHPDDEAIATGGLMLRASRAGHRVVLVCATRGEVGEPQEGVLADGEPLAERRVVELAEACELLGAEPPRFLGYEDSGMMGEPTNDNPDCFWQADFDEAVNRMATILREVDADVVTIYDDNGGYGHPDHIQVHRVGLAAANAVGIEHVYEATINRTRAIEQMQQAIDSGAIPEEEARDFEDDPDFGMEEKDLSFLLDVSDLAAEKKAAIAIHRSQVAPESFFLAMPDEAFAQFFGIESFALPGVRNTGGPRQVATLPGLEI